MLNQPRWTSSDVAWAESQATELNRVFQRYGITSPYGPITATMMLDSEQSFCASMGTSLDETRAERERMMATRPAARVAGIFRQGTVPSGHVTTAAPVAPEHGAVATASEVGGDSQGTETKGAGEN